MGLVFEDEAVGLLALAVLKADDDGDVPQLVAAVDAGLVKEALLA